MFSHLLLVFIVWKCSYLVSVYEAFLYHYLLYYRGSFSGTKLRGSIKVKVPDSKPGLCMTDAKDREAK